MGLDWNPGPKPKQGFEQEFRELFEKIESKSEPEPEANAGDGSFFGGLLSVFGFGKSRAAPPTRSPKEKLVARMMEISTTAFETLDAPQVGSHPEADEWARNRFAQSKSNMSMNRWMDRMKGFYVLDLVPPCDGIPRYSNGQPAGYVEAYSFRADFLKDCEDVVGAELLGEAYESKLADSLVEFGHALIRKAEEYAEDKGIDIETIDTDRLFADAQAKMSEAGTTSNEPSLDVRTQDELKLDVVRAAGRWCVFWGQRGHLMDAYW